jgi:GcrA cell cycle regulator
MSATSWTPALQDRFRADWDAKLSIRQIAERLDITVGMVNRMARKLGLTRRPPIRLGRPRKMLEQSPEPLPPAPAPEPLPPEPILDGLIPTSQRKALFELTDETCRWPVGDPLRADFFFCGGQAVTNLPYCACHARVAYQPGYEHRLKEAA